LAEKGEGSEPAAAFEKEDGEDQEWVQYLFFMDLESKDVKGHGHTECRHQELLFGGSPVEVK